MASYISLSLFLCHAKPPACSTWDYLKLLFYINIQYISWQYCVYKEQKKDKQKQINTL